MSNSIAISFIKENGNKNKWITREEKEFCISNNIHIIVPKYFITDLTSVPTFLWFILPPFGNYIDAAILHDYLYFKKIMCRKKADKQFYFQMKRDEVGIIKRSLMYLAVRLFGNYSWINK